MVQHQVWRCCAAEGAPIKGRDLKRTLGLCVTAKPPGAFVMLSCRLLAVGLTAKPQKHFLASSVNVPRPAWRWGLADADAVTSAGG